MIYKAIAEVQRMMCAEGIQKDRSNQQQGFKFRGIDDVLNAISPMLVSAGLVIIPRTVGREVTERTTAKGGVLFYVVVTVEYDLISAADGSKVTARVCGEAMDSGDKATNKAMSAAYKYMAIQTFAIPTEGDNDADATTHQDVRPQTPKPMPAQKPALTPAEVAAQIVKAHSCGTLTPAQIADRLHITAETDGERASLIFEALPEALQGPVDAAMTGGAK